MIVKISYYLMISAAIIITHWVYSLEQTQSTRHFSDDGENRNGIVIENIDQPSPKDAAFLANAISEDKLLKVDINGGSQAIITITDEPTDVNPLHMSKVLTQMLLIPQLNPEVKQELLKSAKLHVSILNIVWNNTYTEQRQKEILTLHENLTLAIIASENNLPYETLKHNFDLREFLNVNEIGGWSNLVNFHPIKVENNIISIWYDNGWRAWGDVKEGLVQDAKRFDYALKDHVFVEKGFIPGTSTNGIHPLLKAKNLDGKYYFEENSTKVPNHRWVRLTDAEGTIYSVGAFSASMTLPEEKYSWIRYLLIPVLGPEEIWGGHVMSPDPVELEPKNLRKRQRFEITGDQFHQAVEFMKTYQNKCNQDNVCDAEHFVEIVKAELGPMAEIPIRDTDADTLP